MIGSALLTLAILGLAAAAPGDTVETFRGGYVWKVDGHQNEVEAVFTPTGEATWDVEFRFAYARRRGIYQGTARGSLREGSIHGEVEDDGGVLRYGFELEVEGDRLEGPHFDIWSGRKKLNGTLRLERVRGRAPVGDGPASETQPVGHETNGSAERARAFGGPS